MYSTDEGKTLVKVADLKKKLNKLRYETGRKTSRIEALMKQYEKVRPLGKVGHGQVVQGGGDQRRGGAR